MQLSRKRFMKIDTLEYRIVIILSLNSILKKYRNKNQGLQSG